MTDDDARRRGLELQAALPQPRCSRRPRSEGAEVADATVYGALSFGLWGVLLAIPGIAIWVLRRLRRR